MSIEAMNWARKIHVGDGMGKSLLRAIADYADEYGHCWPSLARLADDCDMSIDSVRRRMKLLEEIGVIVTFRAWMDEHGQRNADGRGRETSRDIRCLLDMVRTRETTEHDDDDVDQAGTPLANSKGPLATGEGSQQQGAGSQSARGGVALVPPPNEPPLNREDSPPNPPPGGSGPQTDEGKEPEHFRAFFTGCLGWRTMDEQRALQVFSALTVDEQARAAAASPAHAAECTRFKKRSKDAHKLLLEKFWTRYPDARLPEKPAERHWIASGDLDGLLVALRIADRGGPQLVDDAERGRGLWRSSPITPDLAAMATFAGQDPEAWPLIDADSHEFAAWRTRIREWTGFVVEPRKRWLEPYDPNVHGLSAMHPNFRMRRSAYGLPVPCHWPPRKDGTFCNDNGEVVGNERNV